MNLREILQLSRAQLNEASPVQWNDYQLRRWGTEGQLDLVSRKPTAFHHLLRTFSGTTTSGTADYAFPSDFLAFYAAELNALPALQVDRSEAFGLVAGAYKPSAFMPCVEVVGTPTTTATPSVYARFYPTPGVSTPAYKLWYFKRPRDLFQQVATFEDGEGWTGTGTSRVSSSSYYTTAAPNEEEGGVKALQLTGTGTITGTYTLPVAVDMGLDTTDVVELWVYTNQNNLTSISVEFHTTAGVDYFSYSLTPSVFTPNGYRMRIAKSLFTTTGSAVWNSIAQLRISATSTGAGATVTVDDWRIYRSPEFQAALHPLIAKYITAMALANDEGWREKNDPANLMSLYNAQAEAALGKAA